MYHICHIINPVCVLLWVTESPRPQRNTEIPFSCRIIVMAHAALSIAKFFLAIPDKDSGELISNLKIQKLLYYAQGYYVALHGVARPLFPEKVYAWKHGPVVKAVYNHYAQFKNGALPKEKFVTPMEADTREFLNQ